MVINKSKASNVIALNTAPFGAVKLSISLINTATFEELVFDITPIRNTQRYVSFSLPEDEIEVGMYNYTLIDNDTDKHITKGILKVIDGLEDGVTTPMPDDSGDDIVFYNGK